MTHMDSLSVMSTVFTGRRIMRSPTKLTPYIRMVFLLRDLLR